MVYSLNKIHPAYLYAKLGVIIEKNLKIVNSLWQIFYNLFTKPDSAGILKSNILSPFGLFNVF